LDTEGLPITPAIVRWARERAGYSIEDAARHFKKISAWEAGVEAPSYPQLEQMAEKFKCPVAVFFFPDPPDVPPIESSFRTLTSEDFSKIPRTVRMFLRRGQAMQLNLSELHDGKNPAKRMITRDLSFSANDSLDEIAQAIRQYIGVSISEQSRWRSPETALENWREVFASVGIYVFKEAFRADDYFGFCLQDDQFPIIYVNNSSTKTRQIFTLFHELGHLLFHTSGIDMLDDRFVDHIADEYRKIEIICNGLAARILVPEYELDRVLKGRVPDRNSATELAEYFAVSREVIYRKYLDRGLIPGEEYDAAVKLWNGQIKAQRTGGNYYNSHYAYLGARYIELAFTRYYQHRFDAVKLAEYLNLKPKTLAVFEAKFAGKF
jgi:Zn-dependent peptidase ImmA (M78 family)